MKPPTPEQIAKLPKWAQEHIENCERERDEANRILSRVLADQKPTPFYTTELRGAEPSSGDRFIRRYFDAGRHLTVEHEGVTLTITLPMGLQGRNGIELSWERYDRLHSRQPVVLQPYSYQAMRLFVQEPDHD